MEIAQTRSNGSGCLIFLILGVLALWLLPAMLITDAPAVGDYQHAVEKHGAVVVDEIGNCLLNRGARAIMQHPLSKRLAKICQVDIGRWGIEIDESDGRLVTRFIAGSMFEDVIAYLTKMQYK